MWGFMPDLLESLSSKRKRNTLYRLFRSIVMIYTLYQNLTGTHKDNSQGNSRLPAYFCCANSEMNSDNCIESVIYRRGGRLSG
jgi:hypothetical protein